MLWTKVDHFASRMRLQETCGHHIKRTGHVGKGSVWVVVKIMGTYYHKTFVPSVSEGLVMLHLEHWIFKRVAFFFSFPFIGAGLAGCGATVDADGLMPHQNCLFVECMEENKTGSESALFVKSASLLWYLRWVSELVPENEENKISRNLIFQADFS